jgi:hypothetical protein
MSEKKLKKVLTLSGRLIMLQVEVLRCKQCGKMLGEFHGVQYAQTVCKRCGTVNEINNIE